MNDIEKDIKEAITITFDTKGGIVLLAEDTTIYAVQEKVENKKPGTKTEKPKINTNTNNNNGSANTNKPNQNANNNTNTNNNENTILPEEKTPVVEKTQAEKITNIEKCQKINIQLRLYIKMKTMVI